MKRLTYVTEKGLVLFNGNDPDNSPTIHQLNKKQLNNVASALANREQYCDLIESKLKHYEDLEGQIKKYSKNVNLEKLINCFIETVFKNENHEKFEILTNEDADKYNNWSDLEEQEKLIELPCRVGATVYQLMINIVKSDIKTKKIVYEIYEATVTKYIQDSFYLMFCTKTKIGNHQNKLTLNAFGKTVFLEKPQAEQALAEMESEE